MELHAVIAAVIVSDSEQRRAAGCRDNPEAWWQRCDMVAMAHPDGAGNASWPQPVKQIAWLSDIKRRAAKFAACTGFDPAAKLLAHCLLAVTNPQHPEH